MALKQRNGNVMIQRITKEIVIMAFLEMMLKGACGM